MTDHLKCRSPNKDIFNKHPAPDLSTRDTNSSCRGVVMVVMQPKGASTGIKLFARKMLHPHSGAENELPTSI